METVLTYQSALAGDDEDLEYRCLSEGLKKTIRRQGYSTMRARFLDDLGCIGRWVLTHNRLDDNLAASRRRGPWVDLAFSIGWVEFEVTVEADPWFRVVTAGGAAEAAVPLDEPAMVVAQGPDGGPWLRVAFELPESFVQAADRDGLARVEVEARWKLRELRAGSLLQGLAPLPEGRPQRTLTVPALAWQRGGLAMGYRTVTLLLPLDDAALGTWRDSGRPVLAGSLAWEFPPVGDTDGS